ncbi:PH domain-containing protein [Candidatus Sumerlaeota bacterium]|nr:PH domain-containing protein [Candidatus Sumerlaeota bacterium]
MYSLLKDLVLDFLRCPKEPPDAPAGSHESVQVFRAARAYLTYRLLGLWIGLAVFAVLEIAGLIAALVVLGPVGILVALGLAVFVVGKAVFLYVVTRLDYDMRFYIITDRSLRIREGVVLIREITLTFENIQNMKIEQGPIQRLLGIYNLVVETAGGGSGQVSAEKSQASPMHRGVFRGLMRPEELRDLILSYLRSVRTSGLGDRDDAQEAAHAPGTSRTFAPRAVPPGSSFAGRREIETLRAIRDEVADWRRTIEDRNLQGSA